ncbi:hypothetical protein ABS768_17485 [Flavobacterium sp. ST-75]|uniref:Lipoprotein n=1 Tax=Flavobacterium rhizophilum TaxID=3163296 RepID=A0ABW8YHC1_9FLAO
MKKLMLGIFLICSIYSCRKAKEKNLIDCKNQLKFKLEKVIVINEFEGNTIFLKVKIKNESKDTVFLYDKEPYENRSKDIGFYMENTKDTLTFLFQGDGYIPISPISNKYYFLKTVDEPIISLGNPKDSVALKEYFLKAKLKYNVEDLDLMKADDFKYKKIKTLSDSLNLTIDKGLEFKYLDSLPVEKKVWDSL